MRGLMKWVGVGSLVVMGAYAWSVRAQSAPDIKMNTPEVRSLQSSMEARFDQHLRAAFNQGAIGLTRDGLVQVRDASVLPLVQRASLAQWVKEDNADRAAVYREIAKANGHPEWEGKIREIFAAQWQNSAKPKWWYQDAAGAWKQK